MAFVSDVYDMMDSEYFSRLVQPENIMSPGKSLEKFIRLVELETARLAVKKDPASFVRRGQAKFGIFLIEYAIEDFNEAIKMNPYYVPAYACRSAAYAALNRQDLAEQDRQKCQEILAKEAFNFMFGGWMFAFLSNANKP